MGTGEHPFLFVIFNRSCRSILQSNAFNKLPDFFFLGLALFVAAFFCVITWSDPDVPDSTWNIVIVVGAMMMFLGALLSVIALGIASLGSRLIRVKKIDKPFVWLKDVSPDYLARFPEVPPQQ